MPVAQIKDEKMYRALPYYDWTKADLVKRARELGISGRSAMNKAQLIEALRHH